MCHFILICYSGLTSENIMIIPLLNLRSTCQLHHRLCRIPLRYLASSPDAGSERPKAVVFDMGGVVIPSPVHYFSTFEKKYNLSKGSIVAAIIAGGDEGCQHTIILLCFQFILRIESHIYNLIVACNTPCLIYIIKLLCEAAVIHAFLQKN